MTTTEWHRLTDVDLAARQATCSVCGPGARIRLRTGRMAGHGECMTPRRAARRYNTNVRRQQKYGLTEAQLEALLAETGDTCPVCLRSGLPMALDHDHTCCKGRTSCGRCVRGFLCTGCNKALGFFRDDREALLRAVGYLDRRVAVTA